MASIANVIHTVSPRSISERLKAIYTKKASPQLLHPILVAPLRDSGNLGIREVADLTNTTTRAITATMIAVSEQASWMNDSTTTTAINETASEVMKVEMQPG